MNAGDSSFTYPMCSTGLLLRSRGHMSRSVSCTRGCIGSCLPDSTVLCFLEDVFGRVLVSVHDESAARTHVGTYTQALFDECATSIAILAREMWNDLDGWFTASCSFLPTTTLAVMDHRPPSAFL